MLRKFGCAISALVMTTAVFAGGPDHMAMPAQPESTGHFFVGAEAGMGMLDSTTTASFSGALTGTASATAASNSFLGGLLLGYQTTLANDFYVGVAGNALYNSLDNNVRSVTIDGVTSALKIKNSFQGGADLRLGMNFGDATPYLLGGVEAGSWKVATIEKTLVGPKAGAGVLFHVNQNWEAGLEYAYTWLGDIHSATTGAIVSSSKVDLNQGQIMASATYLF